MTIVAERINTSRKRIKRAVGKRDAKVISREAQTQAKFHATHIDVNAGTSVADEVKDLVWLVETVQKAVDIPLCLDSANPEALGKALAASSQPPLINSITNEKARIEGILPLVVEHHTGVVALTMGDSGMPRDANDRMKEATALYGVLTDAGVEPGRIYFDPVIQPISTDAAQAGYALETVRRIRSEFPESHTICGLSNISFGLPKRNLINRVFLCLMLQAGADGVIIDPTEPGMLGTLLAARAALGMDDFCMDYISAERGGLFER